MEMGSNGFEKGPQRIPLQKNSRGNWTDEQWEAITSRGGHVLVAAGAGSGKTRVLVERILRRVKEGPEAPDLDKLLIVTFTNAAAAEMKQRIGTELEKALQKDPANYRLRRQLLLLNRASISTVHSFCMDVIKTYYYLRDLDPSFRVLDQTEADLLRQEVLEELLEEYYEKESPGSPFYELVDAFSSDRGDQALLQLVLRLYDFSRSHPFPSDWLRKVVSLFNINSEAELEGSGWVKILLQHYRLELASILSRLQKAAEIAQKPGGPAPYLKNLEEEISFMLEASAALHSYTKLFEVLQSSPFGTLKRCSGKVYDGILKERARQLRDSCKKDYAKLQEELSRPLQDQVQELRTIAPLLKTLVEVILSFEKRYQEAKREKGVADFADLEHGALQVLSSPDSTSDLILPSKAALDYRRYFAEVLVDEYQDINQVQETILQLVSLPEPEGNLFMVGDIKQSIYRFRLAEPGLFLEKSRLFATSSKKGLCVGLNYNFRSRKEVLNGVNFLFCQLMDEEVGEIAYDHRAWLRCGASYPEAGLQGGFDVETLLLDRSNDVEGMGFADNNDAEEEIDSEDDMDGANIEELENATLEGRLIAKKIRELMGGQGGKPFEVFERETGKKRPLTYRDIVILLRSARNQAPAILEELHNFGVPAYAELDTGYFAVVEVEVMLSLLKIIDNPFQDIPLAAVLRSPVVGLNSAEMAHIRLAAPGKSFYEALQVCCHESRLEIEKEKIPVVKLKRFLENLLHWREKAREGSLSELIWQLYRDTGYYDFVGGMPGGNRRQANLRALYDRARQYETTSLRGLFRFLRFVERLKEKGGDLGEARALGEQENVVRIMTIHKSKGLEFPVVFVAGLSRKFNLKETRGNFLVHKELGFAPKYVDTELRIAYPTLPYLAVQRHLKLELLAEEMRILYVALTRAEEKLFLVATLKDLPKEVKKWEEVAGTGELLLPAYYRAKATSLLDWIGPALLRHPQCELLREMASEPEKLCWMGEEPSTWKFYVFKTAELTGKAFFEEQKEMDKDREELYHKIAALEPVPASGTWQGEVERRLSWSYPYRQAATHFAKVSVSELQKLQSLGLKGEDAEYAPWGQYPFSALPRYPRFLKKGKFSPGERGTAYHLVMQHLELYPDLDRDDIEAQIKEMVDKQLLTAQEQEAVDPLFIMQFFQIPLGRRMLQAVELFREIPFSLGVPAVEVYPGWNENLDNDGRETILIQGVIDCLFRDKDGLVLIDYKTGKLSLGEDGKPKGHYALQMEYYTRAVERIWQEKPKERYLYFFDSQQVVVIDEKIKGAGFQG
ncbi:MAG: helicase-exonuclease AddAB subunit AddA [Dethiobacteria bacterium]|jgi:ATP-dependent helicase/nuclease subunit A